MSKRKDDRTRDISQANMANLLGPGAYTVKEVVPGPVFSFGTRFNSEIRSKDRLPKHLRTERFNGPGPGEYKLPGAIKVKKNDHKRALSTQDCTFGNGKREWSDIP